MSMIPTASDLLVIALGPAAGSFLGVIADRLPRGEDAVVRRSFCRGCGRTLPARALVPVLSYIAAGGRCGMCGSAIPAWLLHLEIAATGTGVLAAAAGGGPLQVWLSAVLLWLLLGLAACDARWFRLPDALTLPLAGVAVALALASGVGIGPALMGAALGAGAFQALRSGYRRLRGRDGLGAGDVRLMAGLGAYAGPWDLPWLTLWGALAALGLALAREVLRPRGPAGARPVPFGAALCAAAAGLWFSRALGG